MDSEFVFDLGSISEVVYRSLLPELEVSHQRTSPELTLKDSSLVLRVRSDDLVSMRAALNGWLRLIKIAVEMGDAIES